MRNYPKRLDLWNVYLDQVCVLLILIDMMSINLCESCDICTRSYTFCVGNSGSVPSFWARARKAIRHSICCAEKLRGVRFRHDWSTYMVQEIKLNDSVRVRHLFERATSMQIPPKKMKFLFKRHLDYETKHGTAATVKKVKEAAKAYVAQHLASSS